jgi:single-strand DNA-binding protein
MLNQHELIGNLGSDAERKTFGNGGSVVNLTIATNRRWKGKDGEQKEDVQWHRVQVVPEFLQDVCVERGLKGAMVFVRGRVEHKQSAEGKWFTNTVVAPYEGQVLFLNAKDKAREQASESSGDVYDDRIPF